MISRANFCKTIVKLRIFSLKCLSDSYQNVPCDIFVWQCTVLQFCVMTCFSIICYTKWNFLTWIHNYGRPVIEIEIFFFYSLQMETYKIWLRLHSHTVCIITWCFSLTKSGNVISKFLRLLDCLFWARYRLIIDSCFYNFLTKTFW